ncbi:MAG: methionine--tRNA ligase, partial [Polyangiales bacterium]
MTVSTESKTASEKLYLTTAIPFVNARPHLGFALELCIADVLARHARARGRQVHFVTGTDDHSLKNVLAAERDDIPTQRFVAEHGLAFQQLSAALQISHDDFISTSQHPGHHACVEALWHACTEQGDLYRKAYTGLYCVGCERFVDPDETSCAEHPAPLESVTETNWFFRLSRYTELLRAGIERGKLTIIPHGAREETLALLRTTLPDLCVSRSATRARGWGVPVPNDPEQVIWVWFDALAYYLTALGYGSADPHAFTTWWQGHAQRLQVIGKGITRFHALIWPAILSSAGLAWPTDLLVHGYLTHAGAKISKSAGGLDPTPLLEQL